MFFLVWNMEFLEVGKETCLKVCKSKFRNILAHSAIANTIKVLKCASLQIANQQSFMIDWQLIILQFLQRTAQLCLKTVPKIHLLKLFFILYKFELKHYMLYLYGEKVCICRLANNPWIGKSQRDWVWKFAEGLQIKKKYFGLEICNLRFWNFRDFFKNLHMN